jgi:mRNA-degrading endonuclease toxin of MazEF toxin-antitoxin module
MPTSLVQGRIIWAELADANGVRKGRPAVIVTPTDYLGTSQVIEVVAISSRIAKPLPPNQIPLPWHNQGHPRTKLNRPCVAVCDWRARLAPSDIIKVGGDVPAPILMDILTRLNPPPSPPGPVLPPESTASPGSASQS